MTGELNIFERFCTLREIDGYSMDDVANGL